MFESGESVRIIDDMAEVVKLQSGHGGWNDDMGCVSHTLSRENHQFFSVSANAIVILHVYKEPMIFRFHRKNNK